MTFLSRRRCNFLFLSFIVSVAVLLIASCGNQIDKNKLSRNNENETVPLVENADYKVFVVNRRGMAFPDNDFTVSAIFPPANFLVAQVVMTKQESSALPRVLDDSQIEIRYTAVPDINGSINSVSASKTNFWIYANSLYDFYLWTKTLVPEQGFSGETTLAQWMPGVRATPQKFTVFDSLSKTFTAPYIPITPVDDAGQKNYFPLFRVDAIERVSRKVLASTTIPLPMAEPMNCENCHATGQVAADGFTSQRYKNLVWSVNPNLANNAKENIAILHGAATGLDIVGRQPYLCAECHYSPIADPDGRGPIGDHQTRRDGLSIAIHALHGLDRNKQIPASNEEALIPENSENNCKICHGGAQAYTRGVMHQAQIYCQDCHGGMIAVGKSPNVGSSTTRRAFLDEPRCESCHTGDEVSHLGSELVLRRAYQDGDIYATPRLARNRRFAEQPATLYRASIDHGGLTCISCHGSPHAIWPVETNQTHDNDIAIQLQGHEGSVIECNNACHQNGLPLTIAGPHGLHNINDQNWVLNHGSFFDPKNPSRCQSCHGLDLLGGRLAKTAASRSFILTDASVVDYSKGEFVGCADCHALPSFNKN